METDGLSRYRCYVMAPVAPFFLFFLLDYIFMTSSAFSWIPWIVPNNVPVNQLFGAYSGLGMSVLTFSWRQISWTESLLIVPWWAECRIFAGALCAFTMYF